jgi:phosphoribosylformylglycinamidine synthase PurS subunit
MPHFSARIIITLKDGVLDPQGKASAGALTGLGFDGIQSVRQGKVMDVELSAADDASPALIWRRCAKNCSPTR